MADTGAGIYFRGDIGTLVSCSDSIEAYGISNSRLTTFGSRWGRTPRFDHRDLDVTLFGPSKPKVNICRDKAEKYIRYLTKLLSSANAPLGVAAHDIMKADKGCLVVMIAVF